jgi:hypothetical protein
LSTKDASTGPRMSAANSIRSNARSTGGQRRRYDEPPTLQCRVRGPGGPDASSTSSRDAIPALIDRANRRRFGFRRAHRETAHVHPPFETLAGLAA